MKLLAIDTATEACSAALQWGETVIDRYELAPQRHNELILTMVESLLAEAGACLSSLDALAFGRGPGSFTGVRIAAAVTQGIAFGIDLPVVPVSTLAALAQQVFEESNSRLALTCLDARMREVYWAVYTADAAGLATQTHEESVSSPARVTLPETHEGIGIGSGWSVYQTDLSERIGFLPPVWLERFPRARHIARLGGAAFGKGLAVPAEFAVPVYLRDDVARKPILVPAPDGCAVNNKGQL